MVVKDLRMGEFMHAKVEHDEVSESRKYSVGTAVSTPAMQNKWQKVSIPVIQRAKLMFQAHQKIKSCQVVSFRPLTLVTIQKLDDSSLDPHDADPTTITSKIRDLQSVLKDGEDWSIYLEKPQ
jgi:hypothetical protein